MCACVFHFRVRCADLKVAAGMLLASSLKRCGPVTHLFDARDGGVTEEKLRLAEETAQKLAAEKHQVVQGLLDAAENKRKLAASEAAQQQKLADEKLVQKLVAEKQTLASENERLREEQASGRRKRSCRARGGATAPERSRPEGKVDEPWRRMDCGRCRPWGGKGERLSWLRYGGGRNRPRLRAALQGRLRM